MGNIETDLQSVDRWLVSIIKLEDSGPGGAYPVDSVFPTLQLFFQDTDESMTFLLGPASAQGIALDLGAAAATIAWPEVFDQDADDEEDGE